jgi:hypothetical protein
MSSVAFVTGTPGTAGSRNPSGQACGGAPADQAQVSPRPWGLLPPNAAFLKIPVQGQKWQTPLGTLSLLMLRQMLCRACSALTRLE